MPALSARSKPNESILLLMTVTIFPGINPVWQASIIAWRVDPALKSGRQFFHIILHKRRANLSFWNFRPEMEKEII